MDRYAFAEEEQCAVSPLHSCSIEIGDPDALEEPRTSSSPELPDQAESTLQLSQLDASQASAQAALLQLACGPGVSWAGGQPCPSRAGAEQELPSKRRRHLRTRKARETDRRHVPLLTALSHAWLLPCTLRYHGWQMVKRCMIASDTNASEQRQGRKSEG